MKELLNEVLLPFAVVFMSLGIGFGCIFTPFAIKTEAIDITETLGKIATELKTANELNLKAIELIETK